MYQNKIKNAFTILELSVVVVIIAVLVFTTINYSNTMSVNAKNRITKDKLKIIYLALGQYLTNNKKLPCPISLNISKTAVMLQSLTGNACSSDICFGNKCYGGVPVRDLNLSAELSEDGFGNKIFYMVNQEYTTINNFGNYTNIAKNSSNFNIQEQITGRLRNITNTAIVILSSSGANQAHSYRSKNHLTACTAAITNCNYVNTNSITIERNNSIITMAGSTNYPTNIVINDYTSPLFDDIVLYKTEEDFSLDFNQFYLQKCSATNPPECNSLSYNLQATQSCITPSNISRRVKCYQSNRCRFLFDCRRS